MPNVLLYAAGTQQRWNGHDVIKQLLEVDGEAVIDRTIRQMRDRGIDDITVIGHRSELRRPKAKWYEPPHTRWTVETMRVTDDLWTDDTIGIFGDVYLTDRAADDLVKEGGLRTYGRREASGLTGGPAEIFAHRWQREHWGKWREALDAGMLHAEENADKERDRAGCPFGSAWQPYRYLAGVPMSCAGFEFEMWHEINDFTDDFDSPERFQQWKARQRGRWVFDPGSRANDG